jgi:REP element-mobilizing transposase RayT
LYGAVPSDAVNTIQEKYDVKIKEAKEKQVSKDEKKISLYHLGKKYFAEYDNLLEHYAKNDDFLKNPRVAQLVINKMKEYDGKRYNLLAYCVMSNHVHVLFCTADYENEKISKTMQLIKGGSSYDSNQVLQRTGKFWQTESYDHYIRNDKELQNITHYILENPVKAGIVEKWENYPYSYLKI